METLRRKLETVYLGALVDDIREDISDIDLATNVEATRMSALDELIRRATGEPLPDGFDSARGRVEVMDFPPYPESPVFDLSYTLFISNSVPSRRTAYDTIINTGGLGLIRTASRGGRPNSDDPRRSRSLILRRLTEYVRTYISPSVFFERVMTLENMSRCSFPGDGPGFPAIRLHKRATGVKFTTARDV